MPIPTLAIALQAGTEISEALDVIVVAQVVMAAAMAAILLLLLGGVAVGVVLARKVAARAEKLEARLDRIDPLLDVANRMMMDVADLTGDLRGDVDDIRRTLARANQKLHGLVEATEERVRRVGQVLDVVQEHAEDTLLDVASTARGVQAAARHLREKEPPAVHGGAARRRAELRVAPVGEDEFDEP